MRKLLNNPRVILPLATVVLLWVLASYGVIPTISLDIFKSGRSVTSTFSIARKNLEVSASDRAVESLIKEQWLPRSWQKYSMIKHEPFVADFVFDKLEELKPIDARIDPIAPTLPLLETAEELESYIVEHLGLDEMGFFVRFGTINKRQGDLLMTKSGVELVLGSIALAEERRTEAEHDAIIVLVISRMQLLAVIKNASKDVISAADDFVLADLTAAEDIALSTEPSLAELTKSQGTFREGDTVNPELINRSEESQNSASAVISGGQLESQIYRLGDFVQKNPALGLAEVHEDYVQLVDRYGKFYRLNLND